MRVSEQCTITALTIDTFMAPYGLRVHCYTRAAIAAEPFRLLDPQQCDVPGTHK
ncbi:MAG: hypothetical protein ABI432_14890 [Flavobacteriales bacterium]